VVTEYVICRDFREVGGWVVEGKVEQRDWYLISRARLDPTLSLTHLIDRHLPLFHSSDDRHHSHFSPLDRRFGKDFDDAPKILGIRQLK
jgi:hypothetical protein